VNDQGKHHRRVQWAHKCVLFYSIYLIKPSSPSSNDCNIVFHFRLNESLHLLVMKHKSLRGKHMWKGFVLYSKIIIINTWDRSCSLWHLLKCLVFQTITCLIKHMNRTHQFFTKDDINEDSGKASKHIKLFILTHKRKFKKISPFICLLPVTLPNQPSQWSACPAWKAYYKVRKTSPENRKVAGFTYSPSHEPQNCWADPSFLFSFQTKKQCQTNFHNVWQENIKKVSTIRLRTQYVLD